MQLLSIIEISNSEYIIFVQNSSLAVVTKQCIKIFDVFSGKQKQTVQILFDLTKPDFSPDGQVLVTLTPQNQIRIWNFLSSRFAVILDGHQDKIIKLVFSQNSLILASASNDNLIILWDIIKYEQLFSLNKKWEINSLVFSPNSQIVTTYENQKLSLWNVKSGKEIVEFLNCREFNERNGLPVFFSIDSNMVAFCKVDYYIIIWNLELCKEQAKILVHNSIKQMLFTNDSSIIAIQSYDDIIISLWNIQNSTLIHNYESYLQFGQKSFLSHDSQFVAIKGENNNIDLWKAKTGKQIASLSGHKQPILDIVFSPNCQQMATCAWDQTIIIWDIINFKELNQLIGHNHSIQEIYFSPNGQYLVSSSFDQTIRLWNIQNGQQISQLLLKSNQLWKVFENQLVFLLEDQFIIAYMDETRKQLTLSNLRNLDVFHCFSSENDKINLVGFSNDQKLYAYQVQNTLVLWDLQQKKVEQIIEKFYYFFSFSNNSKLIAFQAQQNNNSIDIINIKSKIRITLPEEHTDKINQAIFTLNNEILISCSNDGTIKFWKISQINIVSKQINISGSLECYKTLTAYCQITASNCLITNAEIYSKAGWNLKELFLQKGAKII